MSQLSAPEHVQSDPRPFSVLRHFVPELAEAAANFSVTVYSKTRLPMRIVEGARIRTAQINGCVPCQNFRANRDLPGHLARSTGGAAESNLLSAGHDVPDARFYDEVAEWARSDAFSERERLAIEYAERMGTAPQAMSGDDRFWSRMHASFNDGEIADLTVSIASWIALGRISSVLSTEQVCAMPGAAAEAA